MEHYGILRILKSTPLEMRPYCGCPVMNGSGTKKSNTYFSGLNHVNFCDKGFFGIGRRSPPGWTASTLEAASSGSAGNPCTVRAGNPCTVRGSPQFPLSMAACWSPRCRANSAHIRQSGPGFRPWLFIFKVHFLQDSG
jgi:hypothetical protein